MVTFHHLDGMYSLCTVDSIPGDDNTVHFSAMMPIKKDGDCYVIASEEEAKADDAPTMDDKRGLTK